MIKTALKSGDFEQATMFFHELKALFRDTAEAEGCPSSAPTHIVGQMVELACKERALARFLPELDGVRVTPELLEQMLVFAAKSKDYELSAVLENFGRERRIPFSANTYRLLLKGCGESARASRLFAEAREVEKLTFTPELAAAVVEACSHT